MVVPAHNEQDWIGDLLASIARGRERPRIYVALSACIDATRDVVRSYDRDLDISLLTVQRGLARARNEAARQGDSPWILFLDADVQLCDGFLDKLRAIVSEGASPGPALFGFRYFADATELRTRLGTVISYVYFRIIALLGKPSVPGFCMLVRRDAFEVVGAFDTALAIHEDFDLESRLRGMGYEVAWRRTPWLLASARRFDVPITKQLRLLAHYVRTEVGRLLRGSRYPVGSLNYPMGSFVRHSQRRVPNQVRVRS